MDALPNAITRWWRSLGADDKGGAGPAAPSVQSVQSAPRMQIRQHPSPGINLLQLPEDALLWMTHKMAASDLVRFGWVCRRTAALIDRPETQARIRQGRWDKSFGGASSLEVAQQLHASRNLIARLYGEEGLLPWLYSAFDSVERLAQENAFVELELRSFFRLPTDAGKSVQLASCLATLAQGRKCQFISLQADSPAQLDWLLENGEVLASRHKKIGLCYLEPFAQPGGSALPPQVAAFLGQAPLQLLTLEGNYQAAEVATLARRFPLLPLIWIEQRPDRRIVHFYNKSQEGVKWLAIRLEADAFDYQQGNYEDDARGRQICASLKDSALYLRLRTADADAGFRQDLGALLTSHGARLGEEWAGRRHVRIRIIYDWPSPYEEYVVQ